MILWDFGYNLPINVLPFNNNLSLNDCEILDDKYMGSKVYNIDKLSFFPNFNSFDDDTIFSVPITIVDYEGGYIYVNKNNNIIKEDEYNVHTTRVKGKYNYDRIFIHIYSYIYKFINYDEYDKLIFPDIITHQNSTFYGKVLNEDNWNILFNKYYDYNNFKIFHPKDTIDLLNF